jgi:hypothetical protein
VANLLPQHLFESAGFNNQSHLVAKQENITGEKQVRKFGRQSISLKLCRVLLHAVNLRYGTDGFTSPPKGLNPKWYILLLVVISVVVAVTVVYSTVMKLL